MPDVTRAARFYSSVFNPVLYKERDEPLRYYVTLDPGYIALGSRANEPRAFIDHDCALLKSYDRAAMARRLEAEGLPAGRFGIIPDPDGLGLQLLAVPGGLAGSTVPAGRLVEGEPLVRPRGLAYVVRYVADLERSAAFYRRFFGPGCPRTAAALAFRAAHTRWILRAVPAGEAPRIDRFGVNVARFDAAAVARGLEALGARVVSPHAGAAALPLPRRARRRATARRPRTHLGARMSARFLDSPASVAARRAARSRRHDRAAVLELDAAGRYRARRDAALALRVHLHPARRRHAPVDAGRRWARVLRCRRSCARSSRFANDSTSSAT